MMEDGIVLIEGKENDPLARDIAKCFGDKGKELAKVDFVRFPGIAGELSGETKQVLKENIKGKSVYIIWSIENTNDELIGVLQLLDNAKKTSGAASVTLVMPEYAYGRQDKTHVRREPLSARLIGDLIRVSGADKIITIDLHAEQTEGFFRPMIALKTEPVFADYINSRFEEFKKNFAIKEYSDIVCLSPDEGRARANREFATRINKEVNVAYVDQLRNRKNVNEKNLFGIVGDVKDKVVIVNDDLLASGSTMFNAAHAAKQNCAKYVIAMCAHALGYDSKGKTFKESFLASDIDEFIVTNSRPSFFSRYENDKELKDKIRCINLSKFFAETIRRDYKGETVREMMKEIKDLKKYYTEQ